MWRNIAKTIIIRNNFIALNFKTIRCISVNSRRDHQNNYQGIIEDSKVKYVALFGAGLIAYSLLRNDTALPEVKAASIIDGLKGRRSHFNFVADVVEKSAPAVVYIEIKDKKIVDFFSGRPSTVSNGSGFIVKENGLILTNAHVVASRPHSSVVEVRLYNGDIYRGVVEDIDLQSDLATVRINAKNLPTMTLGDSSQLRPGEFVVAIGSPLALSNSVTSGVVSSTQRGSEELGLHGRDMVYIQTDAAITFGNSGGPLVNLDGEAIGINSMKVTAGISFAIPINYVKKFLSQAQERSRPSMAEGRKKYMGITMITLTPQILSELHQRNQKLPSSIQFGVVVWKVILGSPAHSGGLQPGDIVVEINKNPVKSVSDVYSVLSEMKTKLLRMKVFRNGKALELEVSPEDIG